MISHVSIGSPILWENNKGDKFRVFFDNFHHELIRSTSDKLYVSNADGSWNQFPTKVKTNTDIVGAKLSPDKSLFALCIANKEVKLMEAKTGQIVVARSCRAESVRMLAVHWVTEALSLLFVTNNGVELYALKSLKLKHIKTATYSVAYHWFMPEENILLLVDKKNVFQAFKLNSKAMTKLCKFELDCTGTSFEPPPKGYKFSKKQISLCSLYGQVTCVFINEKKHQLHLLALNNDSMDRTHLYDLYIPGKYEVSVIDNVLVVHNVRAKVSMLFDIRSDAKAPMTAPLPIGFDTSDMVKLTSVGSGSGSGGGGSGATPNGSNESRKQSDLGVPYESWTFVHPMYILDYNKSKARGVLWKMRLNYSEIARSWPSASKPKLVEFLLKRSSLESKLLILSILRQTMEAQTDLAVISKMFNMINRHCYQAKVSQQQAVLSPQGSLSKIPTFPTSHTQDSLASSLLSSLTSTPSSSLLTPSSPHTSSAAPAPSSSTVTVGSPPSSVTSLSGGDPLSPNHLDRASSLSVSIPTSPSNVPLTRDLSLSVSQNPLSPTSPGPIPAGSFQTLPSPPATVPDYKYNPTYPFVAEVEKTDKGFIIITQSDVYKHTFLPATKEIPHAVIIPCLTEYLRSLYRHSLQAEDFLNELLVDLLITEKRHFEFHQHLQYHILNDSLPIAQRLLALSIEYPPAYQLGLDMLYRLNASALLLKTLLDHKEVIEALRLVSPKSHFFEERSLLPREFLRVAESTKDPQVFYSTYKFFEQRNLILRNDRKFDLADGCEEYIKEFERQFGSRPDKKENWYHYDDDDEYVESDDEDERGQKEEDKTPSEGSGSTKSAPSSTSPPSSPLPAPTPKDENRLSAPESRPPAGMGEGETIPPALTGETETEDGEGDGDGDGVLSAVQ